MSDRDDSDDKITVLFSGDDDGEESSDGEPSDPEQQGHTPRDGDEAPESISEQPPEESPGEGGEPEEDNVVRLDFRRETTRKSPRPVADDGRSGEIEPRDGGDIDLDAAKYEAFCRMIDEGMVMVTLDTRVSGVDVPPEYRGLPELRLNFSHMFHIDDFDYDDRGVRASLSFQGERHFCDVPWSAVFMLYSHETGEVVVFEPPSGSD